MNTAAYTAAAPRTYARGSQMKFSKYSEEQVALAKQMLRDAPKVTSVAPGELDRIAKACSISKASLVQIAAGRRWSWIEPAEIDV